MARSRTLRAMAVGFSVALSGLLGLLEMGTAAAAPTIPVHHGCTAAAPTTAAGYQNLFDAKNDRTWAGGDQAASVPLPGGRTLWLFGDTLRGERLADGSRAAGGDLVRNSLLVQTGGCLSAVRGPNGAEAIPSLPDGQWYWPQDAVVLGNEVVVLASREHRTGAGAFGFSSGGVDAAVFRLTATGLVFARMAPTPSSHLTEAHDQYGKAFVRTHDWLLVYGSRAAARSFGRSVVLARVPASELLHPAAWQYWTGRSWSRRATDAVATTSATWSSAFSVYARAGKLHMLTKENDVWGSTVITGTADGPARPFSRRAVLQAPSGRRVDELLYNPLAHPEVHLAGGQLLVTLCRNSSSLTAVMADANLYKPQFLAL